MTTFIKLIHITILNIYSLIVTLAPVFFAASRGCCRPVARLFRLETCRMNIKVVRLTPLTKWATLGSEYFWVLFGKFGQNFLSVFHLHKRGLQALDGVQNLFFQEVVLDDSKSFLEDVVAKLIVDQALNNKVYSRLHHFGMSKSLHKLPIIILVSPLKDFINVMIPTIQTFLNNVRRKF